MKTLNQIIDYTQHLITDKLEAYSKCLNNYYRDINAFIMIRNYLKLTLELLNYYRDQWRDRPIILLPEDAERVITITRWCYISIYSIIEYVSKEIIRRKNHPKFRPINDRLKTGKRVYLINILYCSKKMNLINQDVYHKWEGLTKLRNCITHNNAISDEDRTYNLDGFQIVFEKDKMLKDHWDSFIDIINITIELYYYWLQTIIQL